MMKRSTKLTRNQMILLQRFKVTRLKVSEILHIYIYIYKEIKIHMNV